MALLHLRVGLLLCVFLERASVELNEHSRSLPCVKGVHYECAQVCPHVFLTRTKFKVPRGWFENRPVHLYTPTMIGWIIV